jgi:hypothetical protein
VAATPASPAAAKPPGGAERSIATPTSGSERETGALRRGLCGSGLAALGGAPLDAQLVTLGVEEDGPPGAVRPDREGAGYPLTSARSHHGQTGHAPAKPDTRQTTNASSTNASTVPITKAAAGPAHVLGEDPRRAQGERVLRVVRVGVR